MKKNNLASAIQFVIKREDLSRPYLTSNLKTSFVAYSAIDHLANKLVNAFMDNIDDIREHDNTDGRKAFNNIRSNRARKYMAARYIVYRLQNFSDFEEKLENIFLPLLPSYNYGELYNYITDYLEFIGNMGINSYYKVSNQELHNIYKKVAIKLIDHAFYEPKVNAHVVFNYADGILQYVDFASRSAYVDMEDEDDFGTYCSQWFYTTEELKEEHPELAKLLPQITFEMLDNETNEQKLAA